MVFLSTSTAMDHYRYHPLNTQASSFRLFKLKRGDSSKIEGSIFHASISDHGALPYEALSYAWGCTELVESIKVDGQTLWITENLHSALQCLRYHNQDRLLWIDAICINQSDNVEQSRQVLQMGKIFSFASRVIFWLGKPTAEATCLMESLSELQIRIADSLQKSAKINRTTWKALWSDIHETGQSESHDLSARQQRGLQTLLKRPWFDRIWILQEVLNAQSAIVCSGSLSVSVDIFASCPSFLDFRPNQHVQSVLDLMPTAARVHHHSFQERDNLIDLASKFHASKATDNRDMIFALLGMSSEPLDHGLLRPDYTKSMEEVVRNTIRYWFDTTTVTVSQVLDFLANFKTIRATYIIPLTRTSATSEIIRIPPGSKPLPCVRDAFLLSLEQVGGELCGEKDTFHSELDRLQSVLNTKEQYSPGLGILLRQGSQNGVRIIVVDDISRALELSQLHECSQVSGFLLDRVVGKEARLLSTTLCEAVRRGYSPVVRLLLKEGADVNAVGGPYGTLLQLASHSCATGILQLLLEHGADVNAERGRCNGTALQLASWSGRSETVRLLLEHGADVNAEGGLDGTALQAASRSISPKTVRLLLKHGADVNAQAGPHGTALEAASRSGWLASGSLETVRLLLEHGADVHAQGGKYGTALQAASWKGDSETVKLLLEHGADVNAQGGPYGSALEVARSRDIAQILIDHGAHDRHKRKRTQNDDTRSKRQMRRGSTI